MITIGSTPRIWFDYPLDWSSTEDIRITFRQNGSTRLVLEKKRISYEDGKIYVDLSQSETLGFTTSKMEIQIKVKINGSYVALSNIIVTEINRTIDKEEI